MGRGTRYVVERGMGGFRLEGDYWGRRGGGTRCCREGEWVVNMEGEKGEIEGLCWGRRGGTR